MRFRYFNTYDLFATILNRDLLGGAIVCRNYRKVGGVYILEVTNVSREAIIRTIVWNEKEKRIELKKSNRLKQRVYQLRKELIDYRNSINEKEFEWLVD